MEGIPLDATIRERRGGAESRRLRKEGYIPAIIYGAGEETICLKILKHDFSKIMQSRSGEHSMLELNIEGRTGKINTLSVIKEVQHDPVSDLIIHADLEYVQLGKAMVFVLPIEFLGIPEGVKAGGIFSPHLHEIRVSCKPKDAPEVVEIDVEGITLGDSIHIEDISIPNAEIVNLPGETVASVVKPRGIVEEEKPEEEEEGVEEEGAEKPEEEKQESSKE